MWTIINFRTQRGVLGKLYIEIQYPVKVIMLLFIVLILIINFLNFIHSNIQKICPASVTAFSSIPWWSVHDFWFCTVVLQLCLLCSWDWLWIHSASEMNKRSGINEYTLVYSILWHNILYRPFCSSNKTKVNRLNCLLIKDRIFFFFYVHDCTCTLKMYLTELNFWLIVFGVYFTKKIEIQIKGRWV